MKKKILVFSEYYLPGHKSGGPLRTISNMVEQLSEYYDFFILTKDHDLADKKPYSSINIGSWNNVGGASVYYFNRENRTFFKFLNQINHIDYDIVYLNSFFSFWGTISFLLYRYFSLVSNKPVVIAPRGEFSPGALQLKKNKKKLFIWIAKIIGLYRGVTWQASSEMEKSDITNIFGGHISDSILVAPDLTPVVKKDQLKLNKINTFKPLDDSVLNVVFLSRISPKKNLIFLINVLSKCESKIKLHIYGPLEDVDYWESISKLIVSLPKNIEVEYCGEVSHENVRNTFFRYDLFAFPTLGENFGHVIFESLSSGTPVLLSDQTPWEQDVNGAITVLELEVNLWEMKITEFFKNRSELRNIVRNNSLNYAIEYQKNNKALDLNVKLFDNLG